MLRGLTFAVSMAAAMGFTTMSAGAGRSAIESEAVAACTQLVDPSRTIEGCTALLGISDIGDRIRAAVLHLRGVAHETRGSVDLAIGDFAAARELDPREPAPIMGLAVILGDLRHRCFEEKVELKVIEGCSLLIANAAMAHLAEDIVAGAQAARKAILERRASEPQIQLDPISAGPAKVKAVRMIDSVCDGLACALAPTASVEAPLAAKGGEVKRAKAAEATTPRRRSKKRRLAADRLNSTESAMAGLRGVRPGDRRRR